MDKLILRITSRTFLNFLKLFRFLRSISSYHTIYNVNLLLIYVLQRVDLNLVDFSKTDKYGGSIFKILMTQGIVTVQKNDPSFGNLMSKIEENFFFLISAAKEHLEEEKIDRIIESPCNSGQTVFGFVSFSSEKISGWILDRNIDVAFVDDTWLTPQFRFKSNVEKMLKKGINPFVVSYKGVSEFDNRNFENIDQKLLEAFLSGNITEARTEAYYSFRDSKCSDKCEKSCKDKMLKFKLYTGKRKFKNGKKGGQGIVTFGTWHQEPAAFKLLELGKIKMSDSQTVRDGISNAEKSRAEFEIVSKLSHRNILKVFHVFRHQKTKKRFGIRSAENSTVIVMDKHDKYIGALTTQERIHIPNLLQDVLGYVQNHFLNSFYISYKFLV